MVVGSDVFPIEKVGVPYFLQGFLPKGFPSKAKFCVLVLFRGCLCATNMTKN